eukprot:1146540-Pelagomonas_calceolata.AAC.1
MGQAPGQAHLKCTCHCTCKCRSLWTLCCGYFDCRWAIVPTSAVLIQRVHIPVSVLAWRIAFQMARWTAGRPCQHACFALILKGDHTSCFSTTADHTVPLCTKVDLNMLTPTPKLIKLCKYQHHRWSYYASEHRSFVS